MGPRFFCAYLKDGVVYIFAIPDEHVAPYINGFGKIKRPFQARKGTKAFGLTMIVDPSAISGSIDVPSNKAA